MSSIKGKPIRFIHGTYNRKTGWFDTAKVHTSCCFYVIIDMGEGRDYATRVSKNSVSVIADEILPANYVEAVLQEHPDVEAAFDKLVTLFAACGIQGESPDITRILSEKLIAAGVKQDMKGNMAVWRHTDWDTA
jgi:hypothetical protein